MVGERHSASDIQAWAGALGKGNQLAALFNRAGPPGNGMKKMPFGKKQKKSNNNGDCICRFRGRKNKNMDKFHGTALEL